MGIIIVLIGIFSVLFLYYQTNQISSTAETGREFDKSINTLLTSVSLADIRFTNLLEGNSEIDLQKDIYSQLDIADRLCINIDKGGPNG